ncbi:hypothetical protein E2562_012314 [Oryza meyeriana var. granulata]|uniref:Uncharacterized protein n=1 Tax=Oryza meyeriana var. granulata TaxID=110450 RepID=A0A6G1DHC2_9ORYZ|nr:hypothetical protein E2562_012314 [Oryza meyeriana var. granulata]
MDVMQQLALDRLRRQMINAGAGDDLFDALCRRHENDIPPPPPLAEEASGGMASSIRFRCVVSERAHG